MSREETSFDLDRIPGTQRPLVTKGVVFATGSQTSYYWKDTSGGATEQNQFGGGRQTVAGQNTAQAPERTEDEPGYDAREAVQRKEGLSEGRAEETQERKDGEPYFVVPTQEQQTAWRGKNRRKRN